MDLSESSKTPTKQRKGSITPNACTECKRRRSKCNGGHPCSACAARDWRICVYDVDKRTAVKLMRDRIGRLDERCNEQAQILEAITSGDNAAEIVQQLRTGTSHSDITSRLPKSPPPRPRNESSVTDVKSISGGLDDVMAISPRSEDEGPSAYGTRYRQARFNQASLESAQKQRSPHRPDHPPGSVSQSGKGPPMPGIKSGEITSSFAPNEKAHLDIDDIMQSSPSGPGPQDGFDSTEPWTTVTSDTSFIKHLLELYFCWEYPVFSSLSKKHFLQDFDSGRRRFSSSLLVNVILSLGARFSDKPEGRADPNNAVTAGDHFFEEAKTLLRTTTDHSLPTIQALQLMSLREASHGSDSSSWSYASHAIRLAKEHLNHANTDTKKSESDESWTEGEVRKATLWGCFALDQLWSLMIGRMPHISRHMICIPQPTVVEKEELENWIPYTDGGFSVKEQKYSLREAGTIFKNLCEFSIIINDMLYTLYAPKSVRTSQKIFKAYTQYLDWHNHLSDTLRLGRNFCPSALFLHGYYHCAILLLFRPLLNRSPARSSLDPHVICAEASESIEGILRSYRSLFGLRRTPSFFPHIVLNSGVAKIINNSNGESGGIDIKQALDDLQEMHCHNVAKLDMDILKLFRHRWEPEVMIIGKQQDYDCSGGTDDAGYERAESERIQARGYEMSEDDVEFCHSLCSTLNLVDPMGKVYCCLATGAIQGTSPTELVG